MRIIKKTHSGSGLKNERNRLLPKAKKTGRNNPASFSMMIVIPYSPAINQRSMLLLVFPDQDSGDIPRTKTSSFILTHRY